VTKFQRLVGLGTYIKSIHSKKSAASGLLVKHLELLRFHQMGRIAFLIVFNVPAKIRNSRNVLKEA